MHVDIKKRTEINKRKKKQCQIYLNLITNDVFSRIVLLQCNILKGPNLHMYLFRHGEHKNWLPCPCAASQLCWKDYKTSFRSVLAEMSWKRKPDLTDLNLIATAGHNVFISGYFNFCTGRSWKQTECNNWEVERPVASLYTLTSVISRLRRNWYSYWVNFTKIYKERKKEYGKLRLTKTREPSCTNRHKIWCPKNC